MRAYNAAKCDCGRGSATDSAGELTVGREPAEGKEREGEERGGEEKGEVRGRGSGRGEEGRSTSSDAQ